MIFSTAGKWVPQVIWCGGVAVLPSQTPACLHRLVGRIALHVRSAVALGFCWSIVCRGPRSRDMEAPLPGGSECEVVTFLHVQVEPISEVRVELPPGMAVPVGLPEPDYYSFYRPGADSSELV